MISKDNSEWWKNAILYHIYPMSFMDSNADGIGDIAGIISRLDYLKWLGIDALWISPIYPSPLCDNGYDISNYMDIDPVFGSMSEFDELVKQCHSKEIKIILDYVPNHTSDQHPWFIQARSSLSNDKRDWYIWADPNPAGGPPNNWLSVFGGSAWEFDPSTNQYYYHSFFKQQPDLNWRNLQVQNAMFDVMKFWLEKGIDGFRIDVMGYLIKDKFLRNNPPNPEYKKDMPSYFEFNPVFSTHQQGAHEIIAKMRALMDGYGEKLMLGEVYLSTDELINYYGIDGSGAHLPGNYLFIMEEWNASKIYDEICNYEASLPEIGWPNWVLSNHDHPRIASRAGREQARVAALLMLTSRGTPLIYYGDEIGMHNAAISKDQMKDQTEQSRDPQRTPMQWSSELNAGFTKGKPWLELCEDYETVNVERQKKDPNSFLNLYRDLINLRKKETTLINGTFIPVGLGDNVFAFMRSNPTEGKLFLIVCNFGHKPAIFQVPPYFEINGHVIYGTDPSRKGKKIGRKIKLSSDEAFIAAID